MLIGVWAPSLLADYDVATQRMCVQRGPSDSEDRCANTIYNHKKVFMCFCQGDLCNGSTRARSTSPLWLVAITVTAALFMTRR